MGSSMGSSTGSFFGKRTDISLTKSTVVKKKLLKIQKLDDDIYILKLPKLNSYFICTMNKALSGGESN